MVHDNTTTEESLGLFRLCTVYTPWAIKRGTLLLSNYQPIYKKKISLAHSEDNMQ